MQDKICELVELTERELDAIAGGDNFQFHIQTGARVGFLVGQNSSGKIAEFANFDFGLG